MATLTPVVLVHGLLASPMLMKAMEWRLNDRPVATPSFAPLAARDVRLHAGELDLAIDRERHRQGVDKLDVVGVSQGGLIALWWAQHLDGWSRVRRMCLVGAPIRGTWAAAAGLPLLGAWSDGIWQLLPGSTLVQELAAPVPTESRVTTFSLDTDALCPPARCAVDGAANRIMTGPRGPLGHQWLILSPQLARMLRAELDGPI